MANFVDTVSDVMVLEGIIAGDDDAITNFSSTQHVASIRLAKKAVQQELAKLIADQLIPYEKTSATLTVSARTADLASNFIRLQDENPWLVETDVAGASQGAFIPEYPGGEEKLRKQDLNYRENTGKPSFWYWVGGSSKTLGFYTVPSTTFYYRYYYEQELTVTDESDTVPFVSTTEVNTFIEMCARRFKYLKATPPLREQLFPGGLAKDAIIKEARVALGQLLRYKQPRTRYGRSFV